MRQRFLVWFDLLNGIPGLVFVTLILLLAYRKIHELGHGPYTAAWLTAVLSIAAVLAMTCLVKRLKKSGKLA